jgi:putative hydrolase of the HAD superfamily
VRFPEAVFLDLDDTIFDHQHARRSALAEMQQLYPALAGHSVISLETAHERHLQATFALLSAGKITLPDSRRERQRLFFGDYGVELSPSEAGQAEEHYRRAYDASRRPVPGIIPLIDAVRARGMKVAVITNGLPIEQNEKILLCGLANKLDSVVISGQLGVWKPDKAIFEHALANLGLIPGKAVMIGDSWRNDVLGARNAGIPAIWFNRYDEAYPEDGSRDRVITVTSLEPMETTLKLIELCLLPIITIYGISSRERHI